MVLDKVFSDGICFSFLKYSVTNSNGAADRWYLTLDLPFTSVHLDYRSTNLDIFVDIAGESGQCQLKRDTFCMKVIRASVSVHFNQHDPVDILQKVTLLSY